MKPLVSMREALADPLLFGRVLEGESWSVWRVLLMATMGESLTASERDLFKAVTGREIEPDGMVEEAWFIVGRRGGKSRGIAVLGVYLAALCDHLAVLAPGERGVVPIVSATQAQAGKVFQYIQGILDGSPLLSKEVERRDASSIGLTNRADIEVRTASYRTVRGITALGVVADEVAFWSVEGSANPDTEVLNALRPSLATTGGPLVCISSPYARRGELWNAFRRYYGPAGDPAILVAKGASRTFNPSLSQKVVDRALERDHAAASAEYLAEFRSDVEGYLSREAVDAVTAADRLEVPPMSGTRYFAFVDPSGGSADSFTMAIAHLEGDTAVLDAIREVKPPFSPDGVVGEFAGLLKAYGIFRVSGDRYGGEWPRERFRAAGIAYEPSTKSKNDIYGALLPLVNSRRVELLDSPRLTAQLITLERRTARGGRDTIDHPPGGHDDIANAVAGALTQVAKPQLIIPDAVLERSRYRIFGQ